jgi:23S rRNA (uracil1939-C5)-methyltransferase
MKFPCAHFGTCGGCKFQDMPPVAYLQMKHERVLLALARYGLENAAVEMPSSVLPFTRRRGAVAVAMSTHFAEAGFHAARSHAIVDLKECLVLTPPLLSAIMSFRDLLPPLLKAGEQGELRLTDCSNGIDIALKLPRKPSSHLLKSFAEWARRSDVIRIIANGDIAVQLDEPKVHLADVEVAIPPNSFLQPTRDGERILQQTIQSALDGARHILDLFAGCGTFSFAVARKASVHAVDSDRPALAALESAARKAQKLKPITTEARNLFGRPIQPIELKRFDAVIVDPPRAGCSAQAAALANSPVRRIAYVSCNAETFAHDARILVDSGFDLRWIKPVDQFLWSSHTELVALLERR